MSQRDPYVRYYLAKYPNKPQVNKTSLRIRTAEEYRDARAKHGDLHPATWAALGRLIVAWGDERIPSKIRPTMPNLSPSFPLARRIALTAAMTTATKRLKEALS